MNLTVCDLLLDEHLKEIFPHLEFSGREILIKMTAIRPADHFFGNRVKIKIPPKRDFHYHEGFFI